MEVNRSEAVKAQVICIAPELVHPPQVSSRHASAFSGLDFAQLIHSVKLAGRNVQPILVRRLHEEPGHFEILFGERRHRACLQAGIQVYAIVDESTDDESAFFNTLHENQGRRQLTPLELGRQVRYGLARGIFASQEDASQKLARNKSIVSRAVDIASLPDDVIDAFQIPDQLQYRYAKLLVDAVKADPVSVISEAVKIRAEKIDDPKEVLSRLLGAVGQKVARLNIKPPMELEFEGQAFGKLSFGSDGRAQINLFGELDELQRDILISSIQRFYKRRIHGRAKRKAAIEKMTWKQADKLAAKLNVQMEEMQRDINRQTAYEKVQAEQENPGNAVDFPKME
jgi:ParB family chromosome partitioning protein